MSKLSYDVVICSYNGSKYLAEQIHSITIQSILPEKIFISDDGSTDGTIELIQRIKSTSPIPIVFLSNLEKKGPIGNFIQAIKNSQAEYVFLSDQDDIWVDDKIENYERELVKISSDDSNKPLLLFSDAVVIDVHKNIIHDSFLSFERNNVPFNMKNRLLVQNFVQGATVCLNQRLVQLVRYNDNIVMHDWWLALIAIFTGKIYFINKPLIMYRQHENNSVGATGYSVKRVFSKLFSLNKIIYENRKIMLQNKAFLDEFQSMISYEDKVNIFGLIKANKKSIAWWHYLLSKNINRSTLLRTLSLFILK